MACATGCSDCCHVRLTITRVEAARIRDLVAGWPAERRRSLVQAADIAASDSADSADSGDSGGLAASGASGDPGTARCAALDPAGRCQIYEARPLVCRSHGVPIRLSRGSLPVIESCHRNFVRTAPDADCILDQATLSATLYAIEVAELGGGGPAVGADPAVQRVDLAGLLAALAAI